VLKENSIKYSEFLERLKREHSIETGITETFVNLQKINSLTPMRELKNYTIINTKGLI